MKNSDRIIIEAGKTERQYLRDLWSYHELFIFLAWRDILVRYKQTVFGVLWAIIRPFLTMVVFSVVFGKFAKMPSNGIPYPIIVYAAMLPWQFFANALQESSNSLITNQSLISKIYFPRIIIPISSVISSLKNVTGFEVYPPKNEDGTIMAWNQRLGSVRLKDIHIHSIVENTKGN
jgi:lipopolysaccharide transport system permease protein